MAARPTATIAQIAGAKHINTLAAANLKLRGAQSLFGSLSKSAVADLGLGKTVADAFAAIPKNKLAGYPFPSEAKHAGPHAEPEPEDGTEEEEPPEGQS